MDTSVSSSSGRRLAGPRGLPVLGSFFPMLSEPLALANKLHARYGDVSLIRVYKTPIAFLRNPVDVKRVLIDEPQTFPKPLIDNPFNGNGLTVSRGDHWKRQRHMVQPLFHKEKVRLWSGIFSEELAKSVERWKEMGARGESFDMYTEGARLMFGVMWRTCFDEQPEIAYFDRIMDAIDVFGRRVSPLSVLLYNLVPRMDPRHERVYTSVKLINGWIYERIGKRRGRGTEDGDITLLSMLVEAKARDSGESMNDKEVRDEIVNLFGASFEMIATSLTWAIHACTQHPEVTQAIRDEVQGVTGGAPPRYEDVAKMPYTHRVVQEINRLCPPAWTILRETANEVEVGGVMLPKATQLLLCPYAIHRHPDHWKDAETFDPDRFLPERLSGMHKGAYVPFGAGSRICVGQHMSLVDTVQTLAAVLQELDVEYLGKTPVEWQTRLTFVPKHGMPVRMRARQR
ncbi:cytochrome P450 [Myxococcus stipitatus]|uniref:cytochrome P450 n=1 Tax=Myxococcus stipitatus TaxID=83455 RepID=UPI00314566B1